MGLEAMLLAQPDGAFSQQFHDAMVRSGIRGSPLAFAKKMDAVQLQLAGENVLSGMITALSRAAV